MSLPYTWLLHGQNWLDSLDTKTSLSLFLLAATLFSSLFATLKPSGRSLSHIPVLGEELSTSRRKSEFRYNARAFLERGYNEVCSEKIILRI